MQHSWLKENNGLIELLRFFVCMGIVIMHTHVLAGSGNPLPGGAFGVDFFFLLSGFLMARHFFLHQWSEIERNDVLSQKGTEHSAASGSSADFNGF